MQPSNVVALPAFADNDIRLLHDGTQVVVVDPGDAEPVAKARERLRLDPAGILVMHRRGHRRVHDLGRRARLAHAALTRPSTWKNERQ